MGFFYVCVCVCVCVLLSGLIGYGGLGYGFALCVFFSWWVYSLCVCVCFFFLGGFAAGGDGGGFFFFFVSCGMGGRFVVVVVWVVGFVVTVGSVVVDSAKNSWVKREGDKGERDRERNF